MFLAKQFSNSKQKGWALLKKVVYLVIEEYTLQVDGKPGKATVLLEFPVCLLSLARERLEVEMPDQSNFF